MSAGETIPLADITWSGGGIKVPINPKRPGEDSTPVPVKIQTPVPGDPGSKTITQLTIFGYVSFDKMTDGESSTKKGAARIILPCGTKRGDINLDKISEDLSRVEIFVVRRPKTVEALGFSADSIPDSLLGHMGFLLTGLGFPAHQVSTGVDRMPVSRRFKMNIWEAVLTKLSGPGGYVVPIRKAIGGVAKKRPQGPEMKMSLCVKLETEWDISQLSLNAERGDDGKYTTDVLLYVGIISRKNKKPVDTEYAKNCFHKMGIKMGLGSVGGVSIHVHFTGPKWKASLDRTTGGKRNICYPLAEIAPVMNRVLATRGVAIRSVSLAFQAKDLKDVRESTSVIHNLTSDVIIKSV